MYAFQHHDGHESTLITNVVELLLLLQVIRGNNVIILEAIEPVRRAQ